MELSKKVGYIKGLMAGLKIDGSSPEGQVLCAMSELLEEMADEIEVNSQILDSISDYLDDIFETEQDFEKLEDDIDNEPTEHDLSSLAQTDEEEEVSERTDDIDGLFSKIADNAASESEALDELSEQLEEIQAAEQETDGAPDEQPQSGGAREQINEQTPPQGFDDEMIYECPCPICGLIFNITQTELERGTVHCPGCSNLLEIEN